MDEGGLLSLTQQLSSLGQGLGSPVRESSAPLHTNPFSPSTPVDFPPQPNYSVPHNSPSNFHSSPIRRSLFGSIQVRLAVSCLLLTRFLLLLLSLVVFVVVVYCCCYSAAVVTAGFFYHNSHRWPKLGEQLFIRLIV